MKLNDCGVVRSSTPPICKSEPRSVIVASLSNVTGPLTIVLPATSYDPSSTVGPSNRTLPAVVMLELASRLAELVKYRRVPAAPVIGPEIALLPSSNEPD